MTTIFISGSIAIKQISPLVTEKIDCIISNNYRIILGDANGIDLLIQKYLFSKSYQNVRVYCSGSPSKLRNNVGHWPVVAVKSDKAIGTREFYMAKDIQMSKDADYGLMIWNKESPGTLSNAIELIKQDKYSRVFLLPENKFLNVKSINNIKELLGLMDARSLKKVNSKINSLTTVTKNFNYELPW